MLPVGADNGSDVVFVHRYLGIKNRMKATSLLIAFNDSNLYVKRDLRVGNDG